MYWVNTMDNINVNRFNKAAAQIRKLTISSMDVAGYGHIGGCMSGVSIRYISPGYIGGNFMIQSLRRGM